MKNAKKLVFLVMGLALAATVALTACSNNDDPKDTEPNTTIDESDTETDPGETAPVDSDPETDSSETDPAESDTAETETTETETDEVTEPEETNPVETETDEPESAIDVSLGLDLEGDNYVIGGEEPAHSPMDQYQYVADNPEKYEGKTFVIYGHIGIDGAGNYIVDAGRGAGIFVEFGDVASPSDGVYYKITAKYTAVDGIHCMVAVSAESLE